MGDQMADFAIDLWEIATGSRAQQPFARQMPEWSA
jgi:hypothetical protein